MGVGLRARGDCRGYRLVHGEMVVEYGVSRDNGCQIDSLDPAKREEKGRSYEVVIGAIKAGAI